MESSFKRERKKPMATMNVVPYIDVMLVLLVIFMVTAPMLTQGVKVELPQAVADSMSLDKEPIIISIKANHSYWLKVGNKKDKAVSLENISRELLSLQKNAKESPVLINADHRINYGVVVQLMAKLQQAGVQNVGLLTQAESDAP